MVARSLPRGRATSKPKNLAKLAVQVHPHIFMLYWSVPLVIYLLTSLLASLGNLGGGSFESFSPLRIILQIPVSLNRCLAPHRNLNRTNSGQRAYLSEVNTRAKAGCKTTKNNVSTAHVEARSLGRSTTSTRKVHDGPHSQSIFFLAFVVPILSWHPQAIILDDATYECEFCGLGRRRGETATQNP